MSSSRLQIIGKAHATIDSRTLLNLNIRRFTDVITFTYHLNILTLTLIVAYVTSTFVYGTEETSKSEFLLQIAASEKRHKLEVRMNFAQYEFYGFFKRRSATSFYSSVGEFSTA